MAAGVKSDMAGVDVGVADDGSANDGVCEEGSDAIDDGVLDGVLNGRLLDFLTADERCALDGLLASDEALWRPLPGPQLMAYVSDADVIGYGGAAGGGKTDLACGKALTQHQRVLILRREATQLTAIVDRLTELLGSRAGFNGQEKIWRLPRRQIELGSMPSLDDWNKYQGRPHDLLVFDEAANFLELQVRALLGWLRSVDPKQKCQALLTFNPPTSAQGRWIVDFFAPWLDRHFPNPARPGEVRYAAMAPAHGGAREVWLTRPDAFVWVDGKPCYEFGEFDGSDKRRFGAQEVVRPQGRTFIASRVTDNPFLMGTGYMLMLQGLPEPLRSQMLEGDFEAGVADDPWQVIPTAWVEAAQARWCKPARLPVMDALGVDVARGGRDETIIARRHGMWFDELLAYAGAQTPDGPTTAALVLAARRDHAVVHIDVIGVGSSPFDFLRETGVQVVGVNVAEGSQGVDRSGRLVFKNLRSELWWRMREALDPANNTGIALPPQRQVLADLCAPTWSLQGAAIAVASREEIVKRLGRSPDYGSALVLALMDTPKVADARGRVWARPKEYDPYAMGSRGARGR